MAGVLVGVPQRPRSLGEAPGVSDREGSGGVLPPLGLADGTMMENPGRRQLVAVLQKARALRVRAQRARDASSGSRAPRAKLPRASSLTLSHGKEQQLGKPGKPKSQSSESRSRISNSTSPEVVATVAAKRLGRNRGGAVFPADSVGSAGASESESFGDLDPLPQFCSGDYFYLVMAHPSNAASRDDTLHVSGSCAKEHEHTSEALHHSSSCEASHDEPMMGPKSSSRWPWSLWPSALAGNFGARAQVSGGAEAASTPDTDLPGDDGIPHLFVVITLDTTSGQLLYTGTPYKDLFPTFAEALMSIAVVCPIDGAPSLGTPWTGQQWTLQELDQAEAHFLKWVDYTGMGVVCEFDAFAGGCLANEALHLLFIEESRKVTGDDTNAGRLNALRVERANWRSFPLQVTVESLQVPFPCDSDAAIGVVPSAISHGVLNGSGDGREHWQTARGVRRSLATNSVASLGNPPPSAAARNVLQPWRCCTEPNWEPVPYIAPRPPTGRLPSAVSRPEQLEQVPATAEVASSGGKSAATSSGRPLSTSTAPFLYFVPGADITHPTYSEAIAENTQRIRYPDTSGTRASARLRREQLPAPLLPAGRCGLGDTECLWNVELIQFAETFGLGDCCCRLALGSVTVQPSFPGTEWTTVLIVRVSRFAVRGCCTGEVPLSDLSVEMEAPAFDALGSLHRSQRRGKASPTPPPSQRVLHFLSLLEAECQLLLLTPPATVTGDTHGSNPLGTGAEGDIPFGGDAPPDGPNNDSWGGCQRMRSREVLPATPGASAAPHGSSVAFSPDAVDPDENRSISAGTEPGFYTPKSTEAAMSPCSEGAPPHGSDGTSCSLSEARHRGPRSSAPLAAAEPDMARWGVRSLVWRRGSDFSSHPDIQVHHQERQRKYFETFLDPIPENDSPVSGIFESYRTRYGTSARVLLCHVGAPEGSTARDGRDEDGADDNDLLNDAETNRQRIAMRENFGRNPYYLPATPLSSPKFDRLFALTLLSELCSAYGLAANVGFCTLRGTEVALDYSEPERWRRLQLLHRRTLDDIRHRTDVAIHQGCEVPLPGDSLLSDYRQLNPFSFSPRSARTASERRPPLLWDLEYSVDGARPIRRLCMRSATATERLTAVLVSALWVADWTHAQAKRCGASNHPEIIDVAVRLVLSSFLGGGLPVTPHDVDRLSVALRACAIGALVSQRFDGDPASGAVAEAVEVALRVPAVPQFPLDGEREPLEAPAEDACEEDDSRTALQLFLQSMFTQPSVAPFPPLSTVHRIRLLSHPAQAATIISVRAEPVETHVRETTTTTSPANVAPLLAVPFDAIATLVHPKAAPVVLTQPLQSVTFTIALPQLSFVTHIALPVSSSQQESPFAAPLALTVHCSASTGSHAVERVVLDAIALPISVSSVGYCTRAHSSTSAVAPEVVPPHLLAYALHYPCWQAAQQLPRQSQAARVARGMGLEDCSGWANGDRGRVGDSLNNQRVAYRTSAEVEAASETADAPAAFAVAREANLSQLEELGHFYTDRHPVVARFVTVTIHSSGVRACAIPPILVFGEPLASIPREVRCSIVGAHHAQQLMLDDNDRLRVHMLSGFPPSSRLGGDGHPFAMSEELRHLLCSSGFGHRPPSVGRCDHPSLTIRRVDAPHAGRPAMPGGAEEVPVAEAAVLSRPPAPLSSVGVQAEDSYMMKVQTVFPDEAFRLDFTAALNLELLCLQSRLAKHSRDIIFARLAIPRWLMNPAAHVVPLSSFHRSAPPLPSSARLFQSLPSALAALDAVTEEGVTAVDCVAMARRLQQLQRENSEFRRKHCMCCKKRLHFFSSSRECARCQLVVCKKCVHAGRIELFELSFSRRPFEGVCRDCAARAKVSNHLIHRLVARLHQHSDVEYWGGDCSLRTAMDCYLGPLELQVGGCLPHRQRDPQLDHFLLARSSGCSSDGSSANAAAGAAGRCHILMYPLLWGETTRVVSEPQAVALSSFETEEDLDLIFSTSSSAAVGASASAVRSYRIAKSFTRVLQRPPSVGQIRTHQSSSLETNCETELWRCVSLEEWSSTIAGTSRHVTMLLPSRAVVDHARLTLMIPSTDDVGEDAEPALAADVDCHRSVAVEILIGDSLQSLHRAAHHDEPMWPRVETARTASGSNAGLPLPSGHSRGQVVHMAVNPTTSTGQLVMIRFTGAMSDLLRFWVAEFALFGAFCGGEHAAPRLPSTGAGTAMAATHRVVGLDGTRYTAYLTMPAPSLSFASTMQLNPPSSMSFLLHPGSFAAAPATVSVTNLSHREQSWSKPISALPPAVPFARLLPVAAIHASPNTLQSSSPVTRGLVSSRRLRPAPFLFECDFGMPVVVCGFVLEQHHPIFVTRSHSGIVSTLRFAAVTRSGLRAVVGQFPLPWPPLTAVAVDGSAPETPSLCFAFPTPVEDVVSIIVMWDEQRLSAPVASRGGNFSVVRPPPFTPDIGVGRTRLTATSDVDSAGSSIRRDSFASQSVRSSAGAGSVHSLPMHRSSPVRPMTELDFQGDVRPFQTQATTARIGRNQAATRSASVQSNPVRGGQQRGERARGAGRSPTADAVSTATSVSRGLSRGPARKSASSSITARSHVFMRTPSTAHTARYGQMAVPQRHIPRLGAGGEIHTDRPYCGLVQFWTSTNVAAHKMVSSRLFVPAVSTAPEAVASEVALESPFYPITQLGRRLNVLRGMESQ